MKPTLALRRAALALATFTLAVTSSSATSYYWDTDAATAGAGGAGTPNGTWASGGTTWSPSSAGTVAPPAYTTLAADDLFFAAGTTATGAYTINLVTPQSAKSLTFEEGTVTISGASGVITLGSGGAALP